MDFEATRVIQPRLGSTERLLWAGRPVQGVILRKSDVQMIPFALVWGGFALFWEYTALMSGAPPIMLLFGLIFVLVGVYLLLGRFLVDAHARRHIYYGVTDERVVFLRPGGRPELQTLDLKTITDVTLTKRGADGGVIAFRPRGTFKGLASGSWPGLPHLSKPRFELASAASNTYGIVQSAIRQAR